MLCLEGALRSPMHTEVCIGLDIAHFLSFVYGFICNKDTYFTISSLFLITILIHVSLLGRHNLLICKIYLYIGQSCLYSCQHMAYKIVQYQLGLQHFVQLQNCCNWLWKILRSIIILLIAIIHNDMYDFNLSRFSKPAISD